jgi:flagellar basal-body rod protein FlgF
MERGLYAAASAMMAQQAIQESLAQNIANASTVGFKQDNPTFKALHGMALQRNLNGGGGGTQIGELGMGVANDQVYTDWQSGPRTRTNNPLDVSLDSNQFFAVSTPAGERYTRAGNFRLDGTGQLLTADGMPVLGSNNAPIKVSRGDVHFDERGNVLVGQQNIAQLKIMQGDEKQMRKDGDNLFAANTPAAMQVAAQPVTYPGSLEQSNVNSARSLVQMITVSRAFDMAQRALTTQDALLGHASNELGKL